ncbi:bacterial transcriptional activator domain-containing protein [Actinomycetospora endophytica]|uniref:Bacterial transcriptional activator domain-containing protein n=1 Tax=Actinomycetospora endophytica TaxID=2291215 RepID=A0ABS8PGP3_9PSEU|nr:bacterial transcriptional activator domain-containing protein [Actinomycetospora endophytica]MCD2196164.1 bacterial transcriptional activator domain-containing protein [Actinomycetospora endophytica]
MTDVEIRLLGGIVVERDGVAEFRRSRNHNALLAVLALNAGEPVDGDVLIDQAWGEDLPQNPRSTLHIALSRLRAWLGEREEPWITAAAGSYTLHICRDAVDLLRFHRLTETALHGDDVADHEAARAAWRGTPFPGYDAERLVEARRAAEQRRRALTVHHGSLLLAAGRCGEAADLLISEDRLDEELATLLIRALRDGGRHRAAVDTYLEVRRRLRDEIDAEPGPQLRALYGSLDTSRPARERPRTPELIGRDDVRDSILDALHDDGRLVVLRGRAGVGKSALLRAAVNDAHGIGARTAVSAWRQGEPAAAFWRRVMAELGVRREARGCELGVWVHQRLAWLAQDAPLLLALDDADQADAASLEALRGLARRGPPAGVVIVLAARISDGAGDPHCAVSLSDLAAQHAVTTRVLGPLSPEAVALLVRRRLAHLQPDDALVSAVVERSGGLARHVAEVIDVLGRHGTREGAVEAITGEPHDDLREGNTSKG